MRLVLAAVLSVQLCLAVQQDDLLTRTMVSLDRALDFMGKEIWQSNLDGVVGPRIAADQLQVLLARVDTQLRHCPAFHPLLTELDSLQRKSNSVAINGSRVVSKTQPDYFARVGMILNQGAFSVDIADRYLTPVPPLTEILPGEFSETKSDGCLADMIGSYGKTPCNINDSCWKYMTTPGYNTYFITHQILYLEIGISFGCSQQMAPRMLASYGKTVDDILNEYCDHIFDEAKEFEKENFPSQWRDLMMEQIALCGIVGFRDFLQPKWLDKCLSQQDGCGCYTRQEFTERIGRRKREDTLMKGGCSAHKTAVAIGAMAVSIRFMVDDLIATQPCSRT